MQTSPSNVTMPSQEHTLTTSQQPQSAVMCTWFSSAQWFLRLSVFILAVTAAPKASRQQHHDGRAERIRGGGAARVGYLISRLKTLSSQLLVM